MNESDVRLKLIDPALKKEWNADRQIFTEYYFTDGEIVVRKGLHTRKKPKKADYLLMYKRDMPIAIVEAKDSKHTIEAGLQQAMDYAIALDVPFAYSSNGKGFAEHDFTTGKVRRLSMNEFPSPEELWSRFCASKGIETQKAKKSSPRLTITSTAAIRLATISETPSIEPLKLWQTARTESFSSWRRAPARPIRLSKSYTAYARQAWQGRSSILLIEIFSSIKQ